MQYQEVNEFWFEELSEKDWWSKNDATDALIRKRFSEVHAQANAGDLAAWRSADEGRLAEIIVLDQFSRNMFRGQAASFASDPLAISLAQEAVADGAFKRLQQPYSPFLIMPYMHSESAEVHEQAVSLFSQLADSNQLDFELRHKAIIDRFGRYPHRNAILGRKSTPEEEAFLQEPGSSF